MKKLSVIDHSDSDTEDMADLRCWACLRAAIGTWPGERGKGAAGARLGGASGDQA